MSRAFGLNKNIPTYYMQIKHRKALCNGFKKYYGTNKIEGILYRYHRYKYFNEKSSLYDSQYPLKINTRQYLEKEEERSSIFSFKNKAYSHLKGRQSVYKSLDVAFIYGRSPSIR